MKENQIKILKVEVGKIPYEKKIDNTLEAMQREVDGLIEVVYLDQDTLAIVNEEGKIRNMTPNRWLGEKDIICGDFFVCGDEGEEFTSLSKEQIDEYSSKFMEVPEFSQVEELGHGFMIIDFK